MLFIFSPLNQSNKPVKEKTITRSRIIDKIQIGCAIDVHKQNTNGLQIATSTVVPNTAASIDGIKFGTTD
jgi:hypothetical protein